MSENTMGVILICSVLAIGLYFGGIVGYLMGQDDAFKFDNKIRCQLEFGGKSLQEVPVRCLQYFNLDSNMKGQIK